MSSAVYLTPPEPIQIEEWASFVMQEDGILYSPQTVGGNVFYHGDVEIQFGRPKEGGGLPQQAETITVSTYFMGDLEAVARAARSIMARFRCTADPDPELRALIEPPAPESQEAP